MKINDDVLAASDDHDTLPLIDTLSGISVIGNRYLFLWFRTADYRIYEASRPSDDCNTLAGRVSGALNENVRLIGITSGFRSS